MDTMEFDCHMAKREACSALCVGGSFLADGELAVGRGRFSGAAGDDGAPADVRRCDEFESQESVSQITACGTECEIVEVSNGDLGVPWRWVMVGARFREIKTRSPRDTYGTSACMRLL